MSTVFKPNNILGENCVMKTSEFINPEISFIKESYDYVLESRKEFNKHLRILYAVIGEATTYDVIHEGFHEFFLRIKEILENFIKFIKSLFDKFITMLARLVKSDKYLIKHKADFVKFRDDLHGFKYTGYEYLFSSSIPMPYAAETEFKEGFFDFGNPASDVVRRNAELTNKLKNGFHDKFRATLLDRDGEFISRDNFSEALFSVYRKGSTVVGEFDVTSAMISESFEWFNNFGKTEKALKDLSTTINKSYESIRKYVDSMMRVESKTADNPLNIVISGYGNDGNFFSSEVTPEIRAAIDTFIKMKSTQINEMSNSHAIALGAKLEAYKEKFAQDKILLYKALTRIQSYIKEESASEEVIDNILRDEDGKWRATFGRCHHCSRIRALSQDGTSCPWCGEDTIDPVQDAFTVAESIEILELIKTESSI